MNNSDSAPQGPETVPSSPPVPPPVPPLASSRSSLRGWLIFLAVLLLPALLTAITARNQDLWPFFTFLLSGVTALYCGIWLALKVCRTTVGRVVAGLAFSLLLYLVSFAMCCAGCAVGGANLNIH